MTLSAVAEFDALHNTIRTRVEGGDGNGVVADLAAALAMARAGFDEDPGLWVMRLRMAQRDVERVPANARLKADSEDATRAIIAYARAGAADDPARRGLLGTTLNSYSMQLEAEQRIDESTVFASEFLDLVRTEPTASSEQAHARSRLAELRLRAGDHTGALALAEELVDAAHRNGEIPAEGPSGLPSWLRLRARAYAALGREVEARADFESSLDWERARVRAGKFLAHLDLADALDEYADLLGALGAADDARAAAVSAAETREKRRG
ncbi:hypothetical protein [Amycolatopsis sp. cmx-11-12]|uniref:hypothetical protein n=1 Tax=Amycolatopsis sp. cmx-11-12 TaxID=2785795 RepID=UPI003916FDE7